jgi:hypothetical protein
MWRRAFALLLLSGLAATARGENELKVEPRRVPADESVRIVLVLEGPFASIDEVELPLENLELRGPASTSIEMSFVNGVSSRRKTLTWWASPKGEGPARVGPLVLATDGARDERPAVEIVVAAQPAIDSSNLAQAFDQLYMSGRDQVLLAVDVPKREVWQGEAIDVGWDLYTAASIRRYAIASNPKLDGFWVEEEPIRDAMPEEVSVGGHAAQKVAIRRATLFSLRAGTIEIPALEAGIEVIRPLNDPFGGFSLLEGRVVDVKRRTVATPIVVKPLPGSFDAVGSFTMRRSVPQLSAAGTVAFDVTVSGTGNLRSAVPPRWLEPVDGEVEIEELGTEITTRAPMTMSRRWRYVVFPRNAGPMTLPGMELRCFDPVAGAPAQVGCAASSIVVKRAVVKESSGGDAKAPVETSNEWVPIVGAIAGLLACTLVAALLLRGRKHDAGELAALMSHVDDPRELRRALTDLATKHGREPRALFHESGELGDAWRSIHSLADLVEKEPASVGDARRELRRRAVRLLPLLRQSPN